MSKLQELKRTTGVQAAVAGVAVAIVGALLMAVSSYYDSVWQESQTLEQQEQQLNSEYTTLISRQEKARASVQLYNRLMQNQNGGNFSLDRRVIAELMNDLVDQFLLSDLKVSILPSKRSDDPVFKKATGEVIYSTVTVSFNCVTDEYAYAFLQQLRQRLPGYLYVTEFTMKKTGEITNEVLVNVNKGQRPPLVEAKLVFDWLGLEQTPQTPAPAGPNG